MGIRLPIPLGNVCRLPTMMRNRIEPQRDLLRRHTKVSRCWFEGFYELNSMLCSNHAILDLCNYPEQQEIA